MHELKIIQDIFPMLEEVATKNHIKKITKVVLKIGKLRQVQSDFLSFAFEIVSKDTIAKDAKLITESIPITALCKTCNQKSTITRNTYICLKCQSASLEILTGKEVILASIDGET